MKPLPPPNYTPFQPTPAQQTRLRKVGLDPDRIFALTRNTSRDGSTRNVYTSLDHGGWVATASLSRGTLTLKSSGFIQEEEQFEAPWEIQEEEQFEALWEMATDLEDR